MITDTPTVTTTPSQTLTPTDTLTPSLTPTVTFTPSQTFTPSFTPTLTNIPTFTPTPGQPPSGPVTITYDYDPLYRLTEANYSTGDYYHYTYDSVGNRKSQDTMISGLLTNTAYDYDDANRLVDVNGVTYTWDANGNLLSDGTNTYSYDFANRLTSFNGTSSYAYNGLGDRLSQTVNGDTTNYTLDLNAGLTQVLNDGTNSYLYGNGRIAQTAGATTEYFLGDALGSVRQLTDAQGGITLANAYDPYGTLAQSAGGAQTSYGFTGEFTDPSGMVYLRARYYMPNDGRFLTRDTWIGDYNSPLSLNRWGYVVGNPINFADPSGYSPVCDNGEWDGCGIPDWWKRRSHLYVEGYGYFDSGHLRRGWFSAQWFVREIETTLELGGGVFQNFAGSWEGTELVYWAYYSLSTKLAQEYKDRKLSKDQIYGIAYGMYTDFELRYETYQALRYNRFPSAFSPEDLPSDHLGFWAYIHGLNKDDIPFLLECLGEVTDRGSDQVVSLVIDYSSSPYGSSSWIPRNFKFQPMVTEQYSDPNHGVSGSYSENISWPTWLQLQPIPSGPDTWQWVSGGHK